MFPKDKKNGKATTKRIISAKVKDYSNEPFFIQKAEASKKVIEKYGLPKNLVTGGK
jgi:hypothetical protein